MSTGVIKERHIESLFFKLFLKTIVASNFVYGFVKERSEIFLFLNCDF